MAKEDRQKDKYSPTKNYTEVSCLIWKQIHVLTFWFSKTKTEFELYLQ